MRLSKMTKEEMSLAPYMKKAEAFMRYEKDTLESMELLIQGRKVSIHADIALYMRFFKNEEYMSHADCLIRLYEIFEDWKKEFNVSVSDVFEYTLIRFKRYGELLRKRGIV